MEFPFTLSIFDYQLSRFYKTRHRGTWNHRQILKKILLWDDCGGQEDALYLLPAFFTPKRRPSSRDHVLYLKEEEPGCEGSKENGYFLFCPAERMIEAVNRALSLFREFQDWLWDLKDLSASSRNLQQLLDRSSAYLDISLLIVDQEFQFTAFSDRESCSFRQAFLPEKGRMDLEEIQQLYLNDQSFDRTYTTAGLTLYPIASEEYRNYYYNIFYRRQYLARLLFLLPSAADCPGSHLLMEYLGNIAVSCYQYYYEAKLSKARDSGLYEIFRSLLDGETPDREQAERALLLLGWRPSHSYQILKLQPESRASSGLSLDYLCIQAERAFAESLAVQTGHSIVCVRNLSLSGKEDSFRQALPYFLRESLCRAGISSHFTDFFQCALYAGEADEALNLGSQVNPTFWYYNFSDYTLEYILKKSTEVYPAGELCHPAVKILREYDASHPGSALSETLYQYLCRGLNASRAAEALHVHRTTFLYRMRKIRQLYPIQEENLKEILRLALSFFLISS